jgi:hypothetical protein
MARAMSLSFTFEVTIGDVKHRVTNRPGDVLRLRSAMPPGRSLDDDLAAGGTTAYEVLFKFAHQALRHTDGFEAITLDEFTDRVEDWTIVEDEPARPTVAAPSNEP